VSAHISRNLGKQPPRLDLRTLQLSDYLLTEQLPEPPASINYGDKIPADQWGMMGNDAAGDCTCAAAGHFIQDWTSNNGGVVTISDQAVIAAYSAITGYDPQTGLNDNGAVELDVLNYWRKTGIGQHTIEAYVALEPKNRNHVRDCIYLFGGCYIGLALPVSAQDQRTWSVPPEGTKGRGAPGSWGGHAVVVVGYNARRVTCVTWGRIQQMTWSFWDAYCDEAYAVLSQDWLGDDQKATDKGFDIQTLRADLAQLKQRAALPVAG
jgi:hypothetical protein